jgi:hypothetical protein
MRAPVVVASTLVVAIMAAGHIKSVDAAPRFDQRAEDARIRSHADSVIAELSAESVPGLSVDARGKRQLLLRRLAVYRDEGRFPHNYDRQGLTPTFVDPVTGAYCAVADLMRFSGRDDIVERLVRTDNHLYVQQVSGDTAVAGWLVHSGLTVADAARIQVLYVSAAPTPTQTAREVATPLLGFLSFGSFALNGATNGEGQHRIRTIVGLSTGALAMIAGRQSMRDPTFRDIGQATMMAGTASFALSSLQLKRHFDIERQRTLTVSPTVTTADRSEHGTRFGVSAHVTY